MKRVDDMKTKLNKFSILLLSAVGLLGCFSSSPTVDLSQANENLAGIPIGYQDLRLKGELSKAYRSQESLETLTDMGCDAWTLNDSSLLNILSNMEPVSSEALYALCDQYPCWYQGTVSKGKAEYEIRINAASYIILRQQEEELYFVLKTHEDSFLQACDCCE